jgi:hypothetical protein
MKKIITYVLLEVAVPLALVACLYWPAGETALYGEAHLYYKVFSSGDLIAICIAIALSTLVHLDESHESIIRASGNPPAWYSTGKQVIAIIAIGMGILYVFVKITAMKYSFPEANAPVAENIQAMATWNFCSVVAAAGIGTLIRIFAK